MKTKKMVLLVYLLPLIFMGCVEFSSTTNPQLLSKPGTLKAYNPLTLTDIKGESVTLDTDWHEVSLSMKHLHQTQLVMEVAGRLVSLSVLENLEDIKGIPLEDEFFISATDWRQSYYIEGHIEATTTYSQITGGKEVACQVTHYYGNPDGSRTRRGSSAGSRLTPMTFNKETTITAYLKLFQSDAKVVAEIEIPFSYITKEHEPGSDCTEGSYGNFSN